MKYLITSSVFIFSALAGKAQASYDSITISLSSVEKKWYHAEWPDTLKAGRFSHYISKEKTVWRREPGSDTAYFLKLVKRVKSNGTADIAACFIPRHSINFYNGDKIVRYLLVCFECDGLRFSDDSEKIFVKSISTREKQMQQLKEVFKDML